MRERIYKAVIQRLKAHKVGIKYFSLWNNNVYYLTKQKGFRTPAVFVEFEPIQWRQLQNRTREADMRVRLHVVTATLGTPEDGSKYQDRALEFLTLIDRINAAMQGLAGDGFNAFMLAESVPDHDHEEIMHNEECFVTHVTDTSAQVARHVAAGVKPEITYIK